MDRYHFISFVFVALTCRLACPAVLTNETPWQKTYDPRRQTNDGKEKWNYVNVRSGAHMFWWLYYSQQYQNKPLVMWLQGGPGGSSTGFGNFQELGPLDVNLKPRNTTWLSAASLLFVDNPVGTGFSYAETSDAFTTDVDMIASDLLKVAVSFFKEAPEFQTVPFYIFSESYGGKMTAAFSQVLHKAIKGGQVKCNFKGLAMGDSWISPIDSVLTWGPYLYATSLLDEPGLAAVNKSAMATKAALDAGQFVESTNLWAKTQHIVMAKADNVNFYNIMKWGNDDSLTATKVTGPRDPALRALYKVNAAYMNNDALSTLMNGPIRKKLGIIPKNVTWGAQSGKVFSKQSGDFMKPVVDRVDDLVSNTDLKVVVYTGQLDLIVDTLGTEIWMQKLKWPGLAGYNNAARKPVNGATGNPIAFYKMYKNFYMYWILKSGHMVPADAGEAALKMVQKVISGN